MVILKKMSRYISSPPISGSSKFPKDMSYNCWRLSMVLCDYFDYFGTSLLCGNIEFLHREETHRVLLIEMQKFRESCRMGREYWGVGPSLTRKVQACCPWLGTNWSTSCSMTRWTRAAAASMYCRFIPPLCSSTVFVNGMSTLEV